MQQVRRDLCSPRVLVMEWINGTRCTDPAGVRASGIDINQFIRNGVVSALRQLLEARPWKPVSADPCRQATAVEMLIPSYAYVRNSHQPFTPYMARKPVVCQTIICSHAAHARSQQLKLHLLYVPCDLGNSRGAGHCGTVYYGRRISGCLLSNVLLLPAM